jgi:hypothetical protein
MQRRLQRITTMRRRPATTSRRHRSMRITGRLTSAL